MRLPQPDRDGNGYSAPGMDEPGIRHHLFSQTGLRRKVPAVPRKNIAASAGERPANRHAAGDAGAVRSVAVALIGEAGRSHNAGDRQNRSLCEAGHRDARYTETDARSVLGGTQGVESLEEFSRSAPLWHARCPGWRSLAQALQFPGFLGTDPGRLQLGDQLVGEGDAARPRWPSRRRRTDLHLLEPFHEISLMASCSSSFIFGMAACG